MQSDRVDEKKIEYRLRFEDGSDMIHEVVLESDGNIPATRGTMAYPEWARLAFNRCLHCELEPDVERYCPVATRLAPLVEKLQGHHSFEPVYLGVHTAERDISANTSLQRAMSSLFGLIIASSGCPHTRFLMPMARFHLPMADEQETLYRVASMYLLSQYFARREGARVEMDLAGLGEKYAALQAMNRALAERLRKTSREDASINAVVLLDLLAKYVPEDIDASLDDIRAWFHIDSQPA